MIFLIDDYGNTGMALSRLAGFGLIFFSIFVSEKWFFGSVQVRLWLRLILSLVPAAAVAGVVEFYVVSALSLSWGALVLGGVAGGISYLLVTYLSGLVTEEEWSIVRRFAER